MTAATQCMLYAAGLHLGTSRAFAYWRDARPAPSLHRCDDRIKRRDEQKRGPPVVARGRARKHAIQMREARTFFSCPSIRTERRLRGSSSASLISCWTSGSSDDPVTQTERSVYRLRHTAICMRIILSHGKVNIFNLAKNAGTSVEQIERFYAKHLPLSREMAKNLQSFGEQ